jgi:D-3-phosphoglycerate dehydrogenase
MRILAVGDSYMPPRYFQQAFAALEVDHKVEYFQVEDITFSPTTPSELRIKEYQGTPSEVREHMAGVEALVVQGAPVTDAVLEASPELRFIGCARGGPVNVDVRAVTARGLPLVNSPGKNAEAVADQALAFMIMLARGFPAAQRFLDEGNQLKDNWEGAKFIGSDLRRHTLGLVGFGLIGHQVARRALPFGMRVLVYDPYAEIDPAEGVEQVASLDELLEEADFVSLHARTTKDNINMFDATAFAKMRDGAYFVNTARETLVDEDALDDALASGHLAGAALDVVRHSSETGRHRFLRHPNVVMTPHIGGATHETLLQGAEMIAEELRRFAAGEPLCNLVNREALGL